MSAVTLAGTVSVVIPARNEGANIQRTLEAVRLACGDHAVEILVVDDGSSDDTAERARLAGASVLRLPDSLARGNPARARNHGATAAHGDILVFLDADCVPAPDWLTALRCGHRAASIVGGAFGLPTDLPLTARADYYSCWFMVHPQRAAGFVPNHPPGNLSVRREVLAAAGPFHERHPIAYAHEELSWQGRARRQGQRIYFEPRAVVFHRNRRGIANLMRRSYRWGFSAFSAKAESGAGRMGWLYQHPLIWLALAPALPAVHAALVIGCWVRSRVLEPLVLSPLILLGSFAWSAGVVSGAWNRMAGPSSDGADVRPRWE